jgi:hypothetical protein
VAGTQIQGHGHPGWGLDAGLATLLCKKMIVAKLNKLKADEIRQNLLRKAVAQKGAVLPMMMMMMMNTVAK